MTIQKKEALESRSYNSANGRRKYKRKFHVWDDAFTYGEGTGLNSTSALLQSSVASGDPHPENAAFFATDFDVTQQRDTRHVWEVEWTYEPITPGGGGDDPFEVGFSEINTDHQVEFVDTYRVDYVPDEGEPSFWPPLTIWSEGYPPAMPTTENAEDTDIGGMSVDEAGRPVSSIVRAVRFVITHVTPALTNSDLEFLTGMTGARNKNSSPFIGVPAGQLLYKGASTSRITTDTYRVVHEFIADEFFHMRQVALHDKDGKPIRYSPGGPDSQEYASFVHWIQPFPRLLAFDGFNIPGIPL